MKHLKIILLISPQLLHSTRILQEFYQGCSSLLQCLQSSHYLCPPINHVLTPTTTRIKPSTFEPTNKFTVFIVPIKERSCLENEIYLLNFTISSNRYVHFCCIHRCIVSKNILFFFQSNNLIKKYTHSLYVQVQFIGIKRKTMGFLLHLMQQKKTPKQ